MGTAMPPSSAWQTQLIFPTDEEFRFLFHSGFKLLGSLYLFAGKIRMGTVPFWYTSSARPNLKPLGHLSWL
jgi:hypothetical protein